MNLWQPQNVPMDYPGFRFLVNYDISWQAEELRISKRIDGETCHGVLTFEKHDPGDMMPPTIRFPDEEGIRPLQHLFDALWNAGLRPPKLGSATEVIQVKDDLIKVKDEVIAAKSEHIDSKEIQAYELRQMLFSILEIKI